MTDRLIDMRALTSIIVALLSATAGAADLTLGIGSPDGAVVRPLLGVNAGPAPSGESANADVTNGYRQAGVNAVRTHDFYGPLDMSVMYPDRTKDPAVRSSYDFSRSDEVFRTIIEAGLEPYMRLGDSWNNAAPPASASERANWVHAAVEVLRHYRSGKWDGFEAPIRYVEIWNEPDNAQFWPKPRTQQEFFDLYEEAAVAIKAAFPDLAVGGPGLTPAAFLTERGRSYTRAFLASMSERNVPLDFFSWHMYSNAPADFADAAAWFRSQLDAHGFRATESHITEWNTSFRGNDSDPEGVALRTGSKGAAIMTAAWIELQHAEVEASMFYRGTDTSVNLMTFYGIFYADGRPKKTAEAFSLWKLFSDHTHRLQLSVVAVTDEAREVRAIAAANGESVALLLANPSPHAVALSIEGIGERVVLRQLHDGTRAVDAVTAAAAHLTLAPESVALVTPAEGRRRPVLP